jgi:membrane protein XagC
MRYMISLVAVMFIPFAAVFTVSMSATTAGLVPDDAVTLWASAITAGDGQMPIGRILAAYPTIPFLATALLESVAPAGTPTPVLLTASILALLAVAIFASFRRMDMPLIGGPLIVLLIVLHPAVLRAAIAGPAEMIFTVFLFLLGSALFALRARSAVPEVMAVALSLLGLAFSHPMGAAIAFAAIPLFVFSIRPELMSSWIFNLVLTLVFPTVFCVAAFSYMSWVFPGSGWSFLIAPAEGVANWAVGFSDLFGRGLTGSLSLDAGIAVICALLLGAPVVPVALIWVRKRRPLMVPAVVIIAMTATAASIAILTGFFGDPAPVAVMPPILAVIIIIHVPLMRERLHVVLPLLVFGWIGGIAGLVIVDPRGAMNVQAALKGRNADVERLAAISFGNATVGRDGILVDTLNAPAVVLGRGRARGLLSPTDEAFTLGVLFSRLDTPFVAVPDPQVGIGAQDRLNKAFPLLYRYGATGYQLIYDLASWRLFARTELRTRNRSVPEPSIQ